MLMIEPEVVYVVGSVRSVLLYRQWSFLGVFVSEEEALEFIDDRPLLFIGPAKMGVGLPDDNTVWKDAYYPNGSGLKRTVGYYLRKLFARWSK